MKMIAFWEHEFVPFNKLAVLLGFYNVIKVSDDDIERLKRTESDDDLFATKRFRKLSATTLFKNPQYWLPYTGITRYNPVRTKKTFTVDNRMYKGYTYFLADHPKFKDLINDLNQELKLYSSLVPNYPQHSFFNPVFVGELPDGYYVVVARDRTSTIVRVSFAHNLFFALVHAPEVEYAAFADGRTETIKDMIEKLSKISVESVGTGDVLKGMYYMRFLLTITESRDRLVQPFIHGSEVVTFLSKLPEKWKEQITDVLVRYAVYEDNAFARALKDHNFIGALL